MVHTVTLSPQKIPAEFDYWSHQCNFPSGTHVEEGDKLVSVSFYKDDGVFNRSWSKKPLICSIDILADYDGYVYCDDGTSHMGGSRPYSSKIEDKVFLEIYSTLDELLSSKYEISYEIISDEFSAEKTIRWKKVAGLGYNEGYKAKSGYALIAGSISLQFVVLGGKPILSIIIKKDTLTVRKRDTISFRFEDNSIRSFTVLETPGKMVAPYNDHYFINLKLTKEDIDSFAEKGWDLLRVEHVNGDAPHTYSNSYRCNYQPPFSAFLFKRYAAKFIQALEELGIKLEDCSVPTVNTSAEPSASKDSICYVYLMTDTTNGFYKIGISNNPKYREGTLQAEKPTIELLAAKPFPSRIIAEAIESALHKAFGEKRLRGEWFELTLSDVNDIVQTLK